VSEHLSADDLRQYKQRNANPAALLTWDDHLSECGECRGRLAPGHSLAAWASGLAGDVGETGDAHLTYEQLVARAESRVADADRFAIESHLKQCSSCAEELADLNRFRATVVRPKVKQGARTWPWLAAAAAAVLILGAAIVMLRGVPRHPTVAVVNIPQDWPAPDRAVVEQVLRSEKLPLTPLPADLSSKEGKLLGPSAADPFAPIAPLGAIVESDRPEFRWQPLDRTSSYRVEVYDSAFRPVFRSPALTETAWTPTQPLARGELYRWQIVAEKNHKTITVPSPPAPAAAFRVLDRATEERVTHARATGPMGHLLAAVLLAQAGMARESIQEMDALPEETRRLPEIEKLTR
jgi:hypothetical protein